MQTKLLRVLLAEDGLTQTGITLRSVAALQGRGLELVHVSKADNLRKVLLQTQPHIAFLSLSMLQPDPPLAISLLNHFVPHIPLILFALPADKDCAAGCFASGAKNYLLEGFMDVPTLDRVVHSAIQHHAALPSSQNAKSRLDTLTRLPNRSGLLHEIQRSMEEPLRSGSRLIVHVRLENLKHVQAIAGRSATEGALLQTAQQLRASIRRSDLIAHVSKGLFVLVLADAGDSALAALQRRLAMRLLQINQARTTNLALKFSVQTYSWLNTSPFSFQEILSAQRALRKEPSSPLLGSGGNAIRPPLGRGALCRVLR